MGGIRKEVERLRRKITRIGFGAATTSFNEATNIDLNWQTFDAECDKRFLKFYYKLKNTCDANPGGMDNFLL